MTDSEGPPQPPSAPIDRPPSVDEEGLNVLAHLVEVAGPTIADVTRAQADAQIEIAKIRAEAWEKHAGREVRWRDKLYWFVVGVTTFLGTAGAGLYLAGDADFAKALLTHAVALGTGFLAGRYALREPKST